MKNIKAYINYDAIPSKGYKHQVEITIDDEVDSYVSVMDDSPETVQKVLNEFSIEYNNRLIAEFMELEYEDGLYYYSTLWDDHKTDTLYFNSSWDWLMPVIEKIESKNYWFNRLDGDVSIVNDKGIIINTPMSDGGIDMYYQAVVNFIKQKGG